MNRVNLDSGFWMTGHPQDNTQAKAVPGLKGKTHQKAACTERAELVSVREKRN